MEYFVGIAATIIIVFFFWIEYTSRNFNSKEFHLDNDKQFIVKIATAHLHDIKKENDGYVSMVYGDKRYMYKHVRTIKKSYYYRGRREYIYFVLEKENKNQPPHHA